MKKIKIGAGIAIGIAIGMTIAFTNMIISAIRDTKENHRRIEQLHNNYNTVKTEDEVCGVVIEMLSDKGASFITLGDEKIHIKTSANFLYKKAYLDMILERGDSLFKKKNSDTLFIFKGKDEFYFIHGKK